MDARRAVSLGVLLASVTFAGAAAAGEPEGPVFLPPAPTVHVVIASPVAVELQRRSTPRDAWEYACTGECDKELPLADEYRVVRQKTGEANAPFRFQSAPGGSIVLRVHPASSGAKAGGVALIVVGIGIGILSTVGLGLAASLITAPKPDCSHTDNLYCGVGHDLGVALAAVSGVGELIGGGVVLGGSAVYAGGGPSTSQRPGDVRTPTWRTQETGAAGKSGFVAPLSFTF